MILNDAEIEAKMQQNINEVWPPTMREKAIRLNGQLLIDLNLFFVNMTQVKTQMIADRDAQLAELAIIEPIVDIPV